VIKHNFDQVKFDQVIVSHEKGIKNLQKIIRLNLDSQGLVVVAHARVDQGIDLNIEKVFIY
jgi:hypothetical protein